MKSGNQSSANGEILKGSFSVKGTVQLESAEASRPDLTLKAHVFSPVGELLGSSDVDAKGAFNIAVSRKEVGGALELVVGPAGDPGVTRASSAYKTEISLRDWKTADAKYVFNPEIRIPAILWPNWLYTRVCVGGRIRKQQNQNGVEQLCPVPFVKVEIFDVDRDWCWPWPWLLEAVAAKPDLKAIRLPEILAQLPPRVPPRPDPGPLAEKVLAGISDPLSKVALNPQPLPPRELAMATTRSADFSALESRTTVQSLATLTSRIPYWDLFPWCFYSTQLVCTAYTDCDGYFECCFWWPAFHVRRGRFRFDPRPDIIIKVTQIINGVPTVIYMDPLSNTRWNVTNTFIDLCLNDPEIVCGTGCNPAPEGTTIFYTRVGNDNVYEIEQTNGTWHGSGFSNVAYGASLYLTAAIGKGLSEAPNPFYYRISVSKSGGAFQILNEPLSDTRVDKITLTSQSYALGPNTINAVPALYEIRNTQNYYWYFPDLVGIWDTVAAEPDHDRYVVRLEVFDHNGVKQTSATVDYRDGTVPPPGPLPPMPDHIDLVLAIDNKKAELTLDVPAATNECGVVPFASTPFNINTSVTQPNGRLYAWDLYYEKGLLGVQHFLTGESNVNGLSPLPRNAVTSSAPFTTGLTTTCAFSLILDAWALIRNGYGFVYFSQLIKAVAVEKCPNPVILRAAEEALVK